MTDAENIRTKGKERTQIKVANKKKSHEVERSDEWENS